MKVHIPTLTPYPLREQQQIGSYVSSMPIIQWKELEVDKVRYDYWKAMVKKFPRRERE